MNNSTLHVRPDPADVDAAGIQRVDPPLRSGPPRTAKVGLVLAVSGSALMFAGSLMRPFGTSPDDAARLLDVIGDGTTRWALAHIAYFFGGAALTAAIVLISVWLADRSARSALAAGLLGGIGGAAICGWSAVQLCYLELARLAPRPLMVGAADKIYSSAALDSTVNLPGIGLTVAVVILAVVARRADIIGRVVLAVIVVAALFTFDGILGFVGWPLLAGTLALVGRAGNR